MCRTDWSCLTLSGITKVEEGEGGLPRIVVTNAHADAHIYLHGGTVTHFAPKGERPVLWVSEKSVFKDGKGIRGGIPVCWPWFANHPTQKAWPAHGFVRAKTWSPVSAAQLADGRTRIELETTSDDATRAVAPFEFRVALTVTVGRSLEVRFEATNVGREPWLIEEALHTYFAVGDVQRIALRGLESGVLIDKTAGMARKITNGDFRIAGEVDAVFALDRRSVQISDPAWDRTILVDKLGSDSTVIWNPWSAKSASMADMGADAWKGMVCVETANCHDGRYVLLPGSSHSMFVAIGVRRGSA